LIWIVKTCVEIVEPAVSRATESHRRALAEPDMKLALHPAPIVRPRP